MKLLGNRLLLRQPQAPSKVGSLWVPPEAQQHYRLCQAEVVAVGDGVLDERLEPGAHVITRRFGATSLGDDNEFVVFEEQVMAVVNA